MTREGISVKIKVERNKQNEICSEKEFRSQNILEKTIYIQNVSQKNMSIKKSGILHIRYTKSTKKEIVSQK